MKKITKNSVQSSVPVQHSHSTNSAPETQTTTAAPSAPAADRQDTRLPIDPEARKQNRTLPTPKVLNFLLTTLPAAYRVAEVVGKWVWVTFKEQPTAEVRQQLAQLGFHWNRERQAWQHPCGQFSLGSSNDPHERYSSYRPAAIRRNAKTQEAVTA